MSADLLREAATKIRQDWPLSPFCPDDCNCEDDLPDYHHGATYNRAVADWLDAVAEMHWPKRHDRLSESHYNAEPEHDYFAGDCDESCYVESYICNGCGTAECKPEITGRALDLARAYLGCSCPTDAEIRAAIHHSHQQLTNGGTK